MASNPKRVLDHRSRTPNVEEAETKVEAARRHLAQLRAEREAAAGMPTDSDENQVPVHHSIRSETFLSMETVASMSKKVENEKVVCSRREVIVTKSHHSPHRGISKSPMRASKSPKKSSSKLCPPPIPHARKQPPSVLYPPEILIHRQKNTSRKEKSKSCVSLGEKSSSKEKVEANFSMLDGALQLKDAFRSLSASPLKASIRRNHSHSRQSLKRQTSSDSVRIPTNLEHSLQDLVGRFRKHIASKERKSVVPPTDDLEVSHVSSIRDSPPRPGRLRDSGRIWGGDRSVYEEEREHRKVLNRSLQEHRRGSERRRDEEMEEDMNAHESRCAAAREVHRKRSEEEDVEESPAAKRSREPWRVEYLPGSLEHGRMVEERRAAELIANNLERTMDIRYQEEKTRRDEERLARLSDPMNGQSAKEIFDRWVPLNPLPAQASPLQEKRERNVDESRGEKPTIHVSPSKDEYGYAIPSQIRDQLHDSPSSAGLLRTPVRSSPEQQFYTPQTQLRTAVSRPSSLRPSPIYRTVSPSQFESSPLTHHSRERFIDEEERSNTSANASSLHETSNISVGERSMFRQSMDDSFSQMEDKFNSLQRTLNAMAARVGGKLNKSREAIGSIDHNIDRSLIFDPSWHRNASVLRERNLRGNEEVPSFDENNRSMPAAPSLRSHAPRPSLPPSRISAGAENILMSPMPSIPSRSAMEGLVRSVGGMPRALDSVMEAHIRHIERTDEKHEQLDRIRETTHMMSVVTQTTPIQRPGNRLDIDKIKMRRMQITGANNENTKMDVVDRATSPRVSPPLPSPRTRFNVVEQHPVPAPRSGRVPVESLDHESLRYAASHAASREKRDYARKQHQTRIRELYSLRFRLIYEKKKLHKDEPNQKAFLDAQETQMLEDFNRDVAHSQAVMDDGSLSTREYEKYVAKALRELEFEIAEYDEKIRQFLIDNGQKAEKMPANIIIGNSDVVEAIQREMEAKEEKSAREMRILEQSMRDTTEWKERRAKMKDRVNSSNMSFAEDSILSERGGPVRVLQSTSVMEKSDNVGILRERLMERRKSAELLNTSINEMVEAVKESEAASISAQITAHEEYIEEAQRLERDFESRSPVKRQNSPGKRNTLSSASSKLSPSSPVVERLDFSSLLDDEDRKKEIVLSPEEESSFRRPSPSSSFSNSLPANSIGEGSQPPSTKKHTQFPLESSFSPTAKNVPLPSSSVHSQSTSSSTHSSATPIPHVATEVPPPQAVLDDVVPDSPKPPRDLLSTTVHPGSDLHLSPPKSASNSASSVAISDPLQSEKDRQPSVETKISEEEEGEEKRLETEEKAKAIENEEVASQQNIEEKTEDAPIPVSEEQVSVPSDEVDFDEEKSISSLHSSTGQRGTLLRRDSLEPIAYPLSPADVPLEEKEQHGDNVLSPLDSYRFEDELESLKSGHISEHFKDDEDILPSEKRSVGRISDRVDTVEKNEAVEEREEVKESTKQLVNVTEEKEPEPVDEPADFDAGASVDSLNSSFGFSSMKSSAKSEKSSAKQFEQVTPVPEPVKESEVEAEQETSISRPSELPTEEAPKEDEKGAGEEENPGAFFSGSASTPEEQQPAAEPRKAVSISAEMIDPFDGFYSQRRPLGVDDYLDDDWGFDKPEEEEDSNEEINWEDASTKLEEIDQLQGNEAEKKTDEKDEVSDKPVLASPLLSALPPVPTRSSILASSLRQPDDLDDSLGPIRGRFSRILEMRNRDPPKVDVPRQKDLPKGSARSDGSDDSKSSSLKTPTTTTSTSTTKSSRTERSSGDGNQGGSGTHRSSSDRGGENIPSFDDGGASSVSGDIDFDDVVDLPGDAPPTELSIDNRPTRTTHKVYRLDDSFEKALNRPDERILPSPPFEITPTAAKHFDLYDLSILNESSSARSASPRSPTVARKVSPNSSSILSPSELNRRDNLSRFKGMMPVTKQSPRTPRSNSPRGSVSSPRTPRVISEENESFLNSEADLSLMSIQPPTSLLSVDTALPSSAPRRGRLPPMAPIGAAPSKTPPAVSPLSPLRSPKTINTSFPFPVQEAHETSLNDSGLTLWEITRPKSILASLDLSTDRETTFDAEGEVETYGTIEDELLSARSTISGFSVPSRALFTKDVLQPFLQRAVDDIWPILSKTGGFMESDLPDITEEQQQNEGLDPDEEIKRENQELIQLWAREACEAKWPRYKIEVPQSLIPRRVPPKTREQLMEFLQKTVLDKMADQDDDAYPTVPSIPRVFRGVDTSAENIIAIDMFYRTAPRFLSRDSQKKEIFDILYNNREAIRNGEHLKGIDVSNSI